jgi:hypothetical protein
MRRDIGSPRDNPRQETKGRPMKIEIGESLMRSWLRHIQGCQFAELNWKPSSSWPVCGDVQPLMNAARDHFKNELGVEIFGNQTAYQVLKQGEIDVLGIRLKPNGEVIKVYSVDMAFHEGGLNYGGVAETLNRVLKKLIRSTMVIRSVFGSLPQQAVFASPVVGRPYVSALTNAMQVLEEFLSAHQIACEASLVVNDSFRQEVLDPIIAVATDVADTSELFLRSYQLLRIFEPAAPRTVSRLDADSAEVLRFEFDPSPPDAFKARLLETKMARMTIHYQDEHTEDRIWNAAIFKESSNLLRNLRSRPGFRNGEWQRRKISYVSLNILA